MPEFSIVKREVPASFAQIAAICTATEVEIGDQMVLGIADARNLHAGLGVRRDYATWIKARIARYGFNEGQDFEIRALPKSGERVRNGLGGGENAKIYTLSLDMAKELAMVENNEMGRLARRYFIWAENQVSGSSASVLRLLNRISKLETLIQDRNMEAGGRRVVEGVLPISHYLRLVGMHDAKDRRSFIAACSDRMWSWLFDQRRFDDIQREVSTRTRLFSGQAFHAWWKSDGESYVQELKMRRASKRIGQGVLPFAKKPDLTLPPPLLTA